MINSEITPNLEALIVQTQTIDQYYQQINWTTSLANQLTALNALQEVIHKFKRGVSDLPFNDLNVSCPSFHQFIAQVATVHPIPTAFHQQYEKMMSDATEATFSLFLQQWDTNYFETVKEYKIFQPSITAKWSTAKQKMFVRLFYHIRGNFFKFLWVLGNEAPTAEAKQKVLDNICEEFGGAGMSHEKLYYIFSEAVGITDLQVTEWLNATHNTAEIKAYNQQHLEWLNNEDWDGKLAGFTAYERLDNIDYILLYALAESFGLEKRALAFFKVHQQADHYDRLQSDLKDIWRRRPDLVKKAFYFIAQHQSKMWRRLSGGLCTA